MEAGIRLEPTVADWLAEKAHLNMRPSVFARHPEFPFVIVTPDRLVVKGTRGRKPIAGAEIKTTGFPDGWGEEDTDQIPEHVLLQVHQGMLVMDVPVWHVGVLIGGVEFKKYIVEQDRDLEGMMLEAEREFWKNHVQAGVPPDNFSSPGVSSYLSWRYPQVLEPVREATPEETELGRQLKLYLGVERNAKADVTRLKNQLKASIGEAEGITFDGQTVKWSQRKGSVSWKRAAEAAGLTAKDAEKFRGEGTRVFAPPRSWKKEE
jgi:predicted phage-related endonuclease